MTSRLDPRSIARQVNRKATLPQRLARELRWLWRDIHDLRAEFMRWTDKLVAGEPQIPPHAKGVVNMPRADADPLTAAEIPGGLDALASQTYGPDFEIKPYASQSETTDPRDVASDGF